MARARGGGALQSSRERIGQAELADRLYQAGILRRMPERDLPGLDADRVDASEEAYGALYVGDGFIGLASYSLTALLAAMGPADRARRMPWIPLALGLKAAADAAQAARLTRNQWTEQRAFCSWCLLAAAATFAALPLALSEAQQALAALRRESGGARAGRD